MNATIAATDHSLPSVVLAELKKGGLSPQRLAQAEAFSAAFFARVGDSDIHLHTPTQWAAVVGGLLEFMRQRPAGRAVVRVLSPADIHAGRSLLQIVTDDMPFLIDTVSMVVSATLQIHVVIHPVVTVSRDAAGALQGIGDATGQAESVMHFEIDRAADAAEQELLKTQVEAALEDVRAAVGDWAAMRDKALAVADELPQRAMPLDTASVQEASAFMRWLADDNFTFLGYREYEVTDADGERVLRSVGSSGLGILCKTDRSLAPRSLRTLAATELPQSGATDAIILTKTNARSHVHRPGYMDYVGVLQFGADGRAVAEQRFLGLFTSSSYMTRPQDVPLVRHKVEAVMARSGLKRDSYSGKSLRHILETLPRDELLQGTEDELFNTS
ncbi:MAG TPA: NAD-glutamate dehydrogenase, partial [Rhodanobacter sp.]|nr:NAD-glutamate dehydrogenase [Rhodanobacter sp.]